jgi:hypothetical protein
MRSWGRIGPLASELTPCKKALLFGTAMATVWTLVVATVHLLAAIGLAAATAIGHAW